MLVWEWVFHSGLFNGGVQTFDVDSLLQMVSKMDNGKQNTYLHARLVFSKQFSTIVLIALP
mgnify:FL=1